MLTLDYEPYPDECNINLTKSLLSMISKRFGTNDYASRKDFLEPCHAFVGHFGVGKLKPFEGFYLLKIGDGAVGYVV